MKSEQDKAADAKAFTALLVTHVIIIAVLLWVMPKPHLEAKHRLREYRKMVRDPRISEELRANLRSEITRLEGIHDIEILGEELRRIK